jgi:hypothetical protein
MAGTARADGQKELDKAYAGLERELPDRMVRAIRWLRDPDARWVRLPLAVLCIIGGLLWFLPVLGIDLLPIGLLLIAEDVPFLRKPMARLMIWLERKWVAVRRWWARKRKRK